MLIEDPNAGASGADDDAGGDDSDGAGAGADGGDTAIINPLMPDAGAEAGETDDDAGDEGAGTVPEDAEGYTLPDVDGLDPEALKTSPIVASLRAAAFKAGMTQEAFSEAMTDYAERTKAQLSERAAAEVKLLGENAKQRIASLNAALGQRLPTKQAQAIASSITTAAGIEALEQLLAAGRKAGGAAPSAAPMKDRAEIEKMMADPRYMGNAQQRDAKFIAEIDKWWQDQAKAKK